ncbi:hypothetical protein AtNW77_Chr3g0213371 [Arabidopsis thaliana]
MLRSHQSFPARTWQGHDQSSVGTAVAATAPPLFSNAASSGFSLSATRPPSSSALRQFESARSLCYPPI